MRQSEETFEVNAIKVIPADEFQLPLHAVRQAAAKGRAIFALTNIVKHAVILQSQAVLLTEDDCRKLAETSLWVYRFALGGQCAIVFGDISFCNHADTPNATVSWTRLTSTSAIASLIALTDINANSEIVITYSDAEEYRRRGIIFC
ncbi:MAG: SET domain-containing protein-lysine N-methyltransferase [Rhodomicrobium sp.]